MGMSEKRAAGIPEEMFELIKRFEDNKEAYRSGQYNETQLRREFIDPFFGILGWDVDNRQGYAEAYKDVIHEDAIKIGSAVKAPDYCFRIGGTRKFFVETKPDEYIRRWNDIAFVFSREAVLKGSFDKYAETTKHKKGTAEVDSEFLREIESWRDIFARNIALRNSITQRELNFSENFPSVPSTFPIRLTKPVMTEWFHWLNRCFCSTNSCRQPRPTTKRLLSSGRLISLISR